MFTEFKTAGGQNVSVEQFFLSSVLYHANPFQLQSRPEAPSNVPTVEDFENKSVISFKALHGVAKSKKEKLKLRRKLWHEKIEVCKEKANNKKGKANKKSPAGKRKIIDGENGFQLLLDSLPSVKDRVNELKASKASINAAAAAKAAAEEATGSASKQPKRKTAKQRVKEDLRNIETFNQVLQHPEFQKNPMDTILEHLKNKQEMEKNGEMMDEDVVAPKQPVKSGKSRNRNRRRRDGRMTRETMEWLDFFHFLGFVVDEIV